MKLSHFVSKIKIIPFFIGIFLLATVIFVLYSISFGGAQTYAEYYNVKGCAWNDSYGWASLNCENYDDSVDCNTGGVNPAVDYGVKISTNKNTEYLELSGYAWSSSAGWISLNKSDLSLVSNCESSDNPVPRIIYTSPSDIKLQGCALVLLNGEVINFSGTTTGGVDYGVSGSVETTENPNSITLHSCAWSDVSGWWSFGDKTADGSKDICHDNTLKKHQSPSEAVDTETDNITLNTSITATDTLALFGKNIGINWDCGAPRKLLSFEGLKNATVGQVYGNENYVVSLSEKKFSIECSDSLFGTDTAETTVEAHRVRVTLDATPSVINPPEGGTEQVSVSWSFIVFEENLIENTESCSVNINNQTGTSGASQEDLGGEKTYRLECNYDKTETASDGSETTVTVSIEETTSVKVLPSAVKETNI